MVAHLTGPDAGPKSEAVTSNWDKKIISISTNKMNIKFNSDDYLEAKGFFANIYFTPLPSNECNSWLDMDQKTLKSPNYPQLYHTNKTCHWLISVHHDSHITLNFNVRIPNNYNFILLLEIPRLNVYFLIKIHFQKILNF